MARDKRLREVMDEVDDLLGRLVVNVANMSDILKEEEENQDGQQEN